MTSDWVAESEFRFSGGIYVIFNAVNWRLAVSALNPFGCSMNSALKLALQILTLVDVTIGQSVLRG
jgi:hypothetical protein